MPTDNDQLCRDVAVEVMGTPAEDHGEYGRVGWMKLTGDDMLRVVEKMREDGWKFSGACEGKGKWRTIFWPSGEEFLHLEDTTVDETFPTAVFRAALAAKRSQNNG